MHIQTHQRTRQDVALTFPHQILVGGAKKMSGIGLGVMKYMYFGPEIGLCALLYKMAVQKVQILVTKTHFASTLGQRPSKFTPTLGRRSGEVTKWSDRVPKWSGEVTKWSCRVPKWSSSVP